MTALLGATLEGQAHAQRNQGTAAKLDLAQIKADLESGVESRMLGALAAISSAGAAGVPAAPHVEAVLHGGASQAILERTLVVAGELGQVSSSAAVAPYLRHRELRLQRHAARALARTGGELAVAALRRGLRGRDAEVRDACARGLGELGAQTAVEDLFRALEHQVTAAAVSIGMLCTTEQCDRFTAMLDRQPLEAMLDGLERMLLRPAPQVPDPPKLRAVAALRAIGSPRVGRFLFGVSERWPADGSAEVKAALDEAVERLGAAPGKR